MNPLAHGPLEKLQALVNQPLLASLANNCLLLLFESKDGQKVLERLVLRIRHPWRLMLGSVVVGDSREFPSRAVKSARNSPADWDRWSGGFANWVPGELTGLSFGVNSPDLRLMFLSGHVLEAMSETGLAADWCLYHHKGPEIIKSEDIAKYPWRNHVVS